jgi:phosphatidylglycerophosphate synthase
MTMPALKYSVQDRSILLPHYKRFLIEPTLPFIPSRVNPNTITHGGHLLNLGALLLLWWAARMDSGWPFFAVAILVHVYLWCDNADGSHARRTNQCSAKGEFLDHGLDLLNATYIACMTVVCLGAPPFWSIATAVVIPAAAAVTYWEQAETGMFELGLLNQIESIFCLSIALVARGLFGEEAMARVHVGAFSLPVVILMFVSLVTLFGILRSAMRVFQKRGRLMPFLAPFSFGAAVTVVAATGALGTVSAIIAGAVVFIFMGITSLTHRVRGERPLIERGVLVAAAILAMLAGYRVLGGTPAASVARAFDWGAATIVTIAFGGLALVRALEGHREVERLDRR